MAMHNQDDNDKFASLVKSADQGLADAQVKVSDIYRWGKDCNPDLEKAIKYFEMAANQGNSIAQLNLANLYWKGLGTDKNIEKAQYWLEKGVLKNEPESILNFIYLLTKLPDSSTGFKEAKKWLEILISLKISPEIIDGILNGNERDNLWEKDESITEWFYNKADWGNSDAQYALGLIYSNGIGIAKNEAKAREFFDALEFGDDSDAYLKLGQSYEQGNEKKQDYKYAKFLYERATKLGNYFAKLNLAKLYAHGLGVKQDYEKALKLINSSFQLDKSEDFNLIKKYIELNQIDLPSYFKDDAEIGNPQAQFYYGLLFHHGWGVEKNEDEAKCWIKKSANQDNQKAADFLVFFVKGAEEGDPFAQFQLGMKYARGVDKHQSDYQKAIEWLEKAASQGLAQAQFELGNIYYRIYFDKEKASKYWEDASNQGYVKAHYELGMSYLFGRGTKDYEKGVKEMVLAAEGGMRDAKLELGNFYKNVTHEYDKAIKYFEDSVYGSNNWDNHNWWDGSKYKGLLELAKMYEEGLGVPQDLKKAKELIDEYEYKTWD